MDRSPYLLYKFEITDNNITSCNTQREGRDVGAQIRNRKITIKTINI